MDYYFIFAFFKLQPVCEVVLCAPYTVTEDLLTRFRVHIVCVGVEDNSPIDLDPDTGRDPYAVPKNMGKFLRVDSGNDMTTSKIVDRIIDHRYAGVVCVCVTYLNVSADAPLNHAISQSRQRRLLRSMHCNVCSRRRA
jgi:hypothetical protein